MNIKQLNEHLTKLLEADSLEALQQDLMKRYPQEERTGYQTTTEDYVTLCVDPQTGALILDYKKEITQDLLFNEEKLIQEIKAIKEIPDVPCYVIYTEPHYKDNDGFLGFLSLAFETNKLGSNQIVSFSGGRGYRGTYLKPINDEIEALITKKCGQKVSVYQFIRKTPQGDLYLAKVGSYDKTKAYLIDGNNVKNADIKTLAQIIKSL